MRGITFLLLFLVSNSNASEVIRFGNVFDNGKIFISKVGFQNVDDVIKFCIENNGNTLTNNEIDKLVVSFAMSSRRGKKAFFKGMEHELDSKTSGVGYWLVESQEVSFWYNGRGFESDRFNAIKFMQNYSKLNISFPAVCRE